MKEKIYELLEMTKGCEDFINELIGELEAKESIAEYRRGKFTMRVNKKNGKNGESRNK